jgi:membrane associated rhomboid family serine protease
MIESKCVCGADFRAAESDINFAQRCKNCSRLLTPVCAEALAEGAAAADFDALLVIDSGPKRAGEVLLLGGVPNIEFGKLPGKHIRLEGPEVSRSHGHFRRVDFGPSQWQLEDNKSTNGVYVNSHQITSHPLVDGDRIGIGDYELTYRSMFNAIQAAPPKPSTASGIIAAGQAGVVRGQIIDTTGGPKCPSCENQLAASAKICVACGINIQSGRPLLTSGGMDEEEIEARAMSVLEWLSWIIPYTIFPLPIASAAIETRKPYAIWAIAGLTTLVSLIWFFTINGSDGQTGREMMLWPQNDMQVKTDADIERVAKQMGRNAWRAYQATKRDMKGEVPDNQLARKAFIETFDEPPEYGTFHWYQLFTHMLLHDYSNILAFALHLGGNMLFLLVFGSRVNSLIGNVATLIVYPLLGVASGLSQMYLTAHDFPVPSLGASGAINGLAGMYLILFPIHQIYCAWWWRWRLFSPLTLKVFAVRGFWILLLYFGHDLLIGLLTRKMTGGGTAHWAHIGGFVGGATIALILLLSRQFNTRGGDILSVVLGKRAWPILGKPSQWIAAPPPVPEVRAVSLNYQG